MEDKWEKPKLCVYCDYWSDERGKQGCRYQECLYDKYDKDPYGNADTIKDLQDDLELEKDVLTIRDDEIIELKDKIKELEEETKKHKKTIQDWKDGNYVSIHALRVFIEDYNSGCDEGQEIDTDSADYFCECLDPVIDD